jgi:hypothetical protein
MIPKLLGWADLTCIVDGNLHAKLWFFNVHAWMEAKGNKAILCWNDNPETPQACVIAIERSGGFFAPLVNPDDEIIVARPQHILNGHNIIVTEDKLQRILDNYKKGAVKLPIHLGWLMA